MYRKGLLGEFMEIKVKKSTAVIIFLVACCVWLAAWGTLLDVTNVGAAEAKPHVVKTKWIKPPKRVKNEKPFVAAKWDNPTMSQMYQMNEWEMKKWGAPSLLGLAWCESGYRSEVSAGTYGGYFQYNLSYWPGIWDQIPKKVRVVKKRVVDKPIVRYRKWSHLDHWVRKETNVVHQKRYLVMKGKLPKNASPMHGYAAWRATAYIWSGRGPSVSWECGL